MSTALTKADPMQLSTTLRVQNMRIALDEETDIRGMVAEYVKKNMTDGVDFGVMPGTDRGDGKPAPKCLFKPGAQKLLSLFRCKPVFKLMESVTDLERGYYSYMFRVRLVSRDTKEVLAEGYGSCNSKEGKYRWRDAKRKCPKCDQPTIFTSKRPGEGFYCWASRGGCGAKFPENDPAIVGQVLGKVENEDVATLANTILKMAKKRAEVDGAITLANVADLFTQDVEDLPEESPPANANRFTPPTPPKPPSDTAPQRDASPPQQDTSAFRVPFEPNKGKTMAELSDKDLADQLKKAKASKKEGPYGEANRQWLKAATDEMARRAFPEATGKVSAPPTTSARQAELPVGGDEGEEMVTPTQRLFRLKNKYGLADAKFASIAKGATSKDGNYTHDDLNKIQAAIETMAGALGLGK